MCQYGPASERNEKWESSCDSLMKKEEKQLWLERRSWEPAAEYKHATCHMVTRGSYPLQHPDHLHCQVHEVHECFQKSRLGFKKFSSQGIGVRVRVTLPKQMNFRKIHPTHPRPPFGTFLSPVPKEFMKYIHVYENQTKYHSSYKPRYPDAPPLCPPPLYSWEWWWSDILQV